MGGRKKRVRVLIRTDAAAGDLARLEVSPGRPANAFLSLRRGRMWPAAGFGQVKQAGVLTGWLVVLWAVEVSEKKKETMRGCATSPRVTSSRPFPALCIVSATAHTCVTGELGRGMDGKDFACPDLRRKQRILARLATSITTEATIVPLTARSGCNLEVSLLTVSRDACRKSQGLVCPATVIFCVTADSDSALSWSARRGESKGLGPALYEWLVIYARDQM